MRKCIPHEFCVREGWKKYIDSMIAVDFLILNRDRHGANNEVLRNARAHTLRIAPLFQITALPYNQPAG